jgi:hypothetical protein
VATIGWIIVTLAGARRCKPTTLHGRRRAAETVGVLILSRHLSMEVYRSNTRLSG